MRCGVGRLRARLGWSARGSALPRLALLALLASTGACDSGPSEGRGERSPAVLAPPPASATHDAPPWERLARWADAGYAALGFAEAPSDVRVEVLTQADPATVLHQAAREFALEVLDVGPRTNAETHWIVRRALGRDTRDSPEALLAHEVERQIRSTPLWYDRRLGTVRVVGEHPLFAADRPGGPAWEPWHLMAHEVAHALQDRRAPLRETRAITYEEHVVQKCLYEGEADLLMLALAAAVEGRALREAGADWCEAELARLFARARPSTYDAGFRHLLAVFLDGGWEAVARAVLAPDVTSRDLLAGPAAARAEPASIELPGWPAPGHLGAIEYEWRDEVGAWGILGLLSDDYGAPGASEELALVLLAWRADRLAVALRTDGVPVLMWRIVLADAAAATALAGRFAHADGTLSQEGATLDYAWSPVKTLEREALEALEGRR